MAYAAGNVMVTPGQAPQQMLDLIEAQLSAAGWVFVEQYPASPGWRVWRCPAALNGVRDFYALLYQGGTSFAFGQCEEYDSSTHQMKRGFYNWGSVAISSSNWDAATQTPYGQTGATLTSGTTVSMMNTQSWSTMPTSTFDYVIRVGSRHLCFTFYWPGAGPIGKWLGVFDSLLAVPANDSVPLAQFDLWYVGGPSASTGQGAQGSTSRTPPPATDTTWRYINGVYGGLSLMTIPSVGVLGTQSGSQYNALGGSVDAWGAPAHVAPKFIVQAVSNTSDARVLTLRGKVPGMVGFGAGAGLYIGDEFSFDGKTYVVVSYSNNQMGLAIDKAFVA